MKWLIVILGITFYSYVYFKGIPFKFNLKDIKSYNHKFLYSTKSRTIVSLLKYSSNAEIFCNQSKYCAILPTQSLNTDMPIVIELCETVSNELSLSLQQCEKLSGSFEVTTKDWLRASFLKGR